MHEAKRIIPYVASGPVVIVPGTKPKVWLNLHAPDDFWMFLGGFVRIKDYYKNPEDPLMQACYRITEEDNGDSLRTPLSQIHTMIVPMPENVTQLVTLVHYLVMDDPKKPYAFHPVEGRTVDVKLFEIKKILAGEYPDVKFAPNVITVLKLLANLDGVIF